MKRIYCSPKPWNEWSNLFYAGVGYSVRVNSGARHRIRGDKEGSRRCNTSTAAPRARLKGGRIAVAETIETGYEQFQNIICGHKPTLSSM